MFKFKKNFKKKYNIQKKVFHMVYKFKQFYLLIKIKLKKILNNKKSFMKILRKINNNKYNFLNI